MSPGKRPNQFISQGAKDNTPPLIIKIKPNMINQRPICFIRSQESGDRRQYSFRLRRLELRTFRILFSLLIYAIRSLRYPKSALSEVCAICYAAQGGHDALYPLTCPLSSVLYLLKRQLNKTVKEGWKGQTGSGSGPGQQAGGGHAGNGVGL